MSFKEKKEQEIKLSTFIGSWRKQGSSRETFTYATLTIIDCVDHNKMLHILKEKGVPDHHVTCLLRIMCTDQETTVRTGHGTTEGFKIGKGVQGCILSPCLFNLYSEYIMRNGGLDEAQAGIKIAGRNINNLRYADVITGLP